jgi:excisionase family DNA binding protein
MEMTVDVVASAEVLLHAKQVASILKVRLCTVYELARNGTLPSIRVGSRIVRFRRCSIEEWLAARESGGHDAT